MPNHQKIVWYFIAPLLIVTIVAVFVSVYGSYHAAFWVSFIGTNAVILLNGVYLLKRNRPS